MTYFSGFCLHDESELFGEFAPKKLESIVGFSYGAIEAFEYAINTTKFFKRLVLLSPAYYVHTDEQFRATQLESFKTDPNLYTLKLLKKTGFDESLRDKYGQMGTAEQLQKLLNYSWNEDGFESLLKKGVEIEVFIGGNDRVVDPHKSMEFFRKFATVYFLKDKNHMLS